MLKCGSIDGDRQEARGAEVQRAVLDLRPRLWRGEEKRKLLKEVQVVSLSFFFFTSSRLSLQVLEDT